MFVFASIDKNCHLIIKKIISEKTIIFSCIRSHRILDPNLSVLDPSWISLPKDDIWTSWPLWPLLIFRNHISNESVLCHSYSEGLKLKQQQILNQDKQHAGRPFYFFSIRLSSRDYQIFQVMKIIIIWNLTCDVISYP